MEADFFLNQPNQELSVLYGGPTRNYGGQLLSLYVPRKYDKRFGTPAIV